MRENLKMRMVGLIDNAVKHGKVNAEKLAESILDEATRELLHYEVDDDSASEVLMERLANMRYRMVKGNIRPDAGEAEKYNDPRIFPEGKQSHHQEWIFKRYHGILSGWATVAADRIREDIEISGKHMGADASPSKHGSALQNVAGSLSTLGMTRSQHVYDVMKVKLHVMELEGAAEIGALLWNWAEEQGDSIPKGDVKSVIEALLEKHYKQIFGDEKFDRFFEYWKHKVKQILKMEEVHW